MATPGSSAGGWKIAAPIVLALCGLLFVMSAKAAGGDDLRGSDVLELSDLIRAEDRRARELTQEVEELTAEVDALTRAQGSIEADEVQAQVDALLPIAGAEPVEGPALSVTLDDANPIPSEEQMPAGLNTEDYLVHQEDVEGVMNALWAGGAEAMTVMGQRIVTTSTVRCVGPVLLLEGRQYSPPYRITAIGDPDQLRAALDESEAVRNYSDWVDLIGLGYNVEESEQVTVPAYERALGGGVSS
jgi:uncharacterized protein YlxW (UPF0749 family)